jgi:hypothetical protein
VIGRSDPEGLSVWRNGCRRQPTAAGGGGTLLSPSSRWRGGDMPPRQRVAQAALSIAAGTVPRLTTSMAPEVADDSTG